MAVSRKLSKHKLDLVGVINHILVDRLRHSTVLFRSIRAEDSDTEDEMGGTCSIIWGEEERIQISGGKARRKETVKKTKT
jgi:hypothetical protein